MAASSVGNLVFIVEKIDKTMCLYILRQNMKDALKEIGLSPSFIFQQDNDPKHSVNWMGAL